MFFNSHVFLYVFLPLTLIGYWGLAFIGLARGSMLLLLAASLFFYGWWNPAYLPLLLGSMAVNFTLSRIILRLQTEKESHTNAAYLLWAGLAFNLLLLGYFKYANFFLEIASSASGQNWTVPEIMLPLAVSFFTIQQVVFLVDTYEGLCPDVRALDYFTYVSFFPHLIAGPIVLHNELIPQLREGGAKGFSSANASRGLLLLSIGLIKKLLIADFLAVWAKQGFDGHSALSFSDAWFTSFAYTFQLYFDFSGYSDMAVGIGLLFNLQLPSNFRSPYRARNIIAFWQNWHITLSRFITNYLYTPILKAFPRITFSYSLAATMLAMLIAGLWHGADWRFVLFGALHGSALVANNLWRKKKLPMPAALGWALTILWVNFAFVFFRAGSWADAGRVLRGMFLPSSLTPVSWRPLPYLLTCAAVVLLAPNTEKIQDWARMPSFRWSLLTGVALAFGLTMLEFQNANEFLYFKF